VTIEQNAAKALLTQGKTVPTRAGWALIDTGASNTCIDEQAAQDIGLPVIDVATMQSASHEKHPCNIYPVQIITSPYYFELLAYDGRQFGGSRFADPYRPGCTIGV
jgi:Aspartyl protease